MNDPTATPEKELLVRDEGAVRFITINRPASRNGLTTELNGALIEAFVAAQGEPSVRTVVLGGAGGSFCSGLDLKAAAATVVDREKLEEHLDKHFHGLIRAIRRIPKPVIAFIDGAAAGFGCDLALACDIRVGTPRARLGEIFVKRGLMPDGGGTFHLPRLVGLGVAMELLFTGDIVEAEDAKRIGLLSRIFPVPTADADVLAYAQALAAGAPRVHAWIKRAVYGSLDGTLDDALKIERTGQLELLQSRDFFEGVSAFFQKRPPAFTGE